MVSTTIFTELETGSWINMKYYNVANVNWMKDKVKLYAPPLGRKLKGVIPQDAEWLTYNKDIQGTFNHLVIDHIYGYINVSDPQSGIWIETDAAVPWPMIAEPIGDQIHIKLDIERTVFKEKAKIPFKSNNYLTRKIITDGKSDETFIYDDSGKEITRGWGTYNIRTNTNDIHIQRELITWTEEVGFIRKSTKERKAAIINITSPRIIEVNMFSRDLHLYEYLG